MSEGLEVQRLSGLDLHDNVALARAVGWHDVEDDWRVIHEAAYVVGVRREGRLVAQGALGLYGSAGTIAKMIVAPDFRRQGLGAMVLEVLLEEAATRSISVLGLVATPSGQPLYERHSFTCVGEVVVMTGTPDAAPASCRSAPLTDAEAAISMEEQWLGGVRAAMTRARFRQACATATTVDSGGEACGYAMATTQGSNSLVGPVLAKTEAHARRLADAIFRSVDSPVRIDVPAEQTAFRNWLRVRGLQERGVRQEMAIGAHRLPWQVRQRFALSALAWG